MEDMTIAVMKQIKQLQYQPEKNQASKVLEIGNTDWTAAVFISNNYL